MNNVQQKNVLIWHARTNVDVDPDCILWLRSMLDDSERRRLDGLVVENVRREYLFTHALCRMMLSAYTSVAPGDWRFAPNNFGRPEIAIPAHSSVRNFNLSNTSGQVACAISDADQIGVDIERVVVSMDVEDIARRYFSTAECEALSKQAPADRRNAFFELWVLKEAYTKACGKGFAIPFDSFSIIRSGSAISVCPEHGKPRLRQHWRFWLGELDDHQPIAVAAADRLAFKLAVTQFDATQLLLSRQTARISSGLYEPVIQRQ